MTIDSGIIESLARAVCAREGVEFYLAYLHMKTESYLHHGLIELGTGFILFAFVVNGHLREYVFNANAQTDSAIEALMTRAVRDSIETFALK